MTKDEERLEIWRDVNNALTEGKWLLATQACDHLRHLVRQLELLDAQTVQEATPTHDYQKLQ